MSRSINGDGNIHQRKNGLWQLDIIIAGRRRSFYGKSEQEVLNKANLAADEASATSQGYTLDKWFDDWMSSFVQTKNSTKKKYERDYRLYVKPYIGGMKMADITTLDIQRVYLTNLSKGLSPKSVYNVHGVLSSMFKKAIKLGFIQKNVVRDCELPKLIKPEMYPLMDENTGRFLRRAKSDRFYYVYFTAIFTGMRQSQLIGLTWDCIDFKKNTVRVYRQLVKTGSVNRKGVFEFTSLKNNKQRSFIAPDQVIKVFERIKEKQKKNNIYSDDGFVFTNPNGQHIQYHTLYAHFKKIVAQIGIPKARFHDLRHTYATLSIQNGSDIKTVSSNLGHATVAFTMDRYGHVSDRMKEQAAHKMEAMISEIC